MTNHHLCHSGKSSTCRYCDPPNRMPAARNHPQPRDACACSSERVAWEREHTVDTRAYMVPRTRTHETPISETTKVWKYSLWISTIQISSSATCRTGKLESKQRQKLRRCVGNHHGGMHFISNIFEISFMQLLSFSDQRVCQGSLQSLFVILAYFLKFP